MKMKMLSMAIAVLLFTGIMGNIVDAVPIELTAYADSDISNNDAPFSGKGTEAEPYQISTSKDLFTLAELMNNADTNPLYRYCYYVQTCDIDLENAEFMPIGIYYGADSKYVFAGVYDGNYHSINNLYISSDTYYCGLFGRIGEYNHDNSKSAIKNLSVSGKIERTSKEDAVVGGIVGEIGYGASIANCSFTGEVISDGIVGGITGSDWCGGKITSCYVNADMTKESKGFIGGIVGKITVGANTVVGSGNFSMTNSYFTGNITKQGSMSENGICGLAEKMSELDASISFDNVYYPNIYKGAANSGKIDGCTGVSDKLLKSVDELLGQPFVSDSDETINDGYPVFVWQTTPYQFKGSGTQNEPYQISSKEDLSALAELINNPWINPKYRHCYYIQTCDIDLQDIDWTPIGIYIDENNNLTENAIFEGYYNGNHHKITNLNVNYAGFFTGLFGRIGGGGGAGEIANLNVYGTVASSAESSNVGGISGEIGYGAKIQNCSFTGKVSGASSVGGITGFICAGGEIVSSYFNGSISSKNDAGGIAAAIHIGKNSLSKDAAIKNCYAVGTIEAQNKKGGIFTILVEDNAVSNHLTLESNYYLNTMAETGSPNNSSECVKLTKNLLKSSADMLGSPFVDNTGNTFNDGYPVFSWQIPIAGDMNQDGEVSVNDVVLMQKYLHAQEKITEEQYHNADLNDDGTVNIYDLILMKRTIIQKGESLL